MYWHAVALVNMARVEDSLTLFRGAFAFDRHRATLTPPIAKVGLLPDDARLLAQIVGPPRKRWRRRLREAKFSPLRTKPSLESTATGAAPAAQLNRGTSRPGKR
jgi:hypothetical protein